jgi:succinyl-diaminopimelate desuccinylase
MTSTLQTTLRGIVDAAFAAECDFLAEMVKVPTDNPPGDCAAHANRTRGLLEAMGLPVEVHPVPADVVL